MMRFPLFAAVLLMLLAGACTRKSAPPVPKPEAFPRVSSLSDDYIAAADSLPLHMEFNSAASVSSQRMGWIDVTYPQWRATLHITIAPSNPTVINQMIANRAQRIALDIGSSSVSRDSIFVSSDDFSSVIISSPEVRATPLHFISTDDSDWVVSGTAFFYGVEPNAPIDSLAPVVDFITADLRHTLGKLATRQ